MVSDGPRTELHIAGRSACACQTEGGLSGVDWQFGFLGYQTSIGELVVVVALPLLVALIVEPLRRWLSRTWDFCLDRAASLSDNLRANRIKDLELRTEQLNVYNDRQALFLFLRTIFNLVVWFFLLIFLNEFTMRLESLVRMRRITEFFKIPDPLVFGYATHEPSWLSDRILIIGSTAMTLVMVILLYFLMLVAFRQMDDFADPPKAIKKLEERISALKAKGRDQAQ